MGKKITYLLGAGASANAIPIVSEMHDRLQEMSTYFYKVLKNYTDAKIPSQVEDFNIELYYCLGTLSHIYDEFEWLIKEAGREYSIDTLAKKFYLMGNFPELERLKKILITYFTLEQILEVSSSTTREYKFKKHTVDKRYGNFIAGITRKTYRVSESNLLPIDNFEFELNRQVSILSWNYDMQFELSLRSLTSTIIHHIKENFQILPNNMSKDNTNGVSIAKNRFAMVKLNGDACWEFTAQAPDFRLKRTIFDSINSELESEKLLIQYLQRFTDGNINGKKGTSGQPSMSFNFAWEDDVNFHNKYPGYGGNLEVAEQLASETEILVVIGYSFPVFNREIDRRIFDKMNKLQKVYIQDKNPSAISSTMRSSFKVLQKKKQEESLKARHVTNSGVTEINEYSEVDAVRIVEVANTDQFVIPYELE